MLSWAEEQGLREANTNPCFGIKKYKETKRQRYLTMDEIARLGAALNRAETDHLAGTWAVAAIRLLILTGARLSEILTLRRTYVDFDRRLILLPDSKTGEKTIQLSDAAADVLRRIPAVEGNPYVIVGHRTGQPMVDLFKPWSIVRRMAALEDVRLHDLRHTFASVAVAQGGSLPIIGKMLGHNEPRTTARYAHLADDPVQRLTETTGRAIADALVGARSTD
jgi:integrase